MEVTKPGQHALDNVLLSKNGSSEVESSLPLTKAGTRNDTDSCGFKQIHLPLKAIAAAKEAGMAADAFYAFALLEATGICIIPGSGFGQREGTFHFRTTILAQKDVIKSMLARLGDFHVKFLEEYKD
jgi:hypothetical protein